MSNWFKLSPDLAQSRAYLSLCAVYRCLKRYGASRQWCLRRLEERAFPDAPKTQRAAKARRMLEIWDTVNH